MNIQQKLTLIQNEVKVNKSKYNQHGKFYYRSLEDIFEAVKQPLYEHGCSLRVEDDLAQIGDRVFIRAVAYFSDGENTLANQAFALHAENQKGMQDAQLTGSTSSYARKYALSGLLLLDDNEDVDSKPVTNYPTPPKPVKAPEATPPDEKTSLLYEINSLAKTKLSKWGASEADELAKNFKLKSLRDGKIEDLKKIIDHLNAL